MHTLGPWSIDKCLDIKAGPLLIANVAADDGPHDSEAEANAALIAAAPDLLAALKAIVEPCLCYGRKRGEHGILCLAARAAIAKAEGRA